MASTKFQKQREAMTLQMQLKCDEYFEKTKNVKGNSDRHKATRRALWLVIQKDFSMSAASAGVARTCRVEYGTITKKLQAILPSEYRNHIRKRSQAIFFRKFENK